MRNDEQIAIHKQQTRNRSKPPIVVMETCFLPLHPSQRMLMLILFIGWWTAETTFDMNLGQMQYVADHLTNKECRQLVDALGAGGVLLDKMPTGAQVANVSCIRLLLQWDRTEGRGQSFVELSVRLKQIGRSDIADYLSNSIYGEKVNAIYESILNNPIRSGVSPGIGLLSARDQPAPPVRPSHDGEEGVLKTWHLVAIGLGALAIGMLVTFLVLKYAKFRCRCRCRCKTPDCWRFLKENVPIYVFGVTPQLPRELRERKELLLAEERAVGNPYIV